LPNGSALLPNIVLGGDRGFFHLLQAKDLESGRELAARVEKEISRGKQFRAAHCRVRTSVSAVEMPAMADGVDIDKLAAQIEGRISRAVAQAERGDVNDEQPAPTGPGHNGYAAVV